ncbi:MAG: hypothetical protein DI532_22585 [Azospirillum brasilense]|nr:MAG: hypothetical protein DI532_22585 [Azospirillum brasilense]
MPRREGEAREEAVGGNDIRMIRPDGIGLHRRRVLASAAGLVMAGAGGWSLAQPVPDGLAQEAEALLRRMSESLSRAATLAVDCTSLREVRLADGRVATLISDLTLALHRPNRLRADLRGDAVLADVYYDGRQVAVHAVAQGAFARMDAPPTIDGLTTLLQERLRLPLDIGLLLGTDPYARLAEGASGAVVSPSEVSGRPVWHLLLRSGEVDWEIWLDQAPAALPLLAAVRRGGLRTVMRFDEWRLGPQIADSLFRFTPPPGAREIPFVIQGGQP